jgi:hypothetical protein
MTQIGALKYGAFVAQIRCLSQARKRPITIEVIARRVSVAVFLSDKLRNAHTVLAEHGGCGECQGSCRLDYVMIPPIDDAAVAAA